MIIMMIVTSGLEALLVRHVRARQELCAHQRILARGNGIGLAWRNYKI